ncbi:MAG TPA: MFS transporter, partial [Mycobacteriales bacterium]|nr:MFS transporter [Mycobacteriales bacterium]
SRCAGWLVVAAVCVGAFMGQLDASIVTVGLPRLSHGLHASVGATQWVSLSYLLTLVALVAPFGSWADSIGRKSLYVAGFAVFGVASAGCAVAPDLPVLCAARVLQAVGAALLQANSVALIATNVSDARLGRALGAQAAAQAIGLAAGPAIGGLLLAVGSWRLLFLANVPAAVIGVASGVLLLPRSRELQPLRRVDRVGVVGFVTTLGVLLLAMSLASGPGGDRLLALPVGAVAVIAMAALIRQQRRSRAPLFDPRLIARRAVRRGLVNAGVGYAVVFGTLFAAAFALAHGVGAGQAGLVLAALPVGIGLAAAFTRHSPHGVPQRSQLAGPAITVAGLAAIAVLVPSAPVLAALLCVVGFGFGMFTPANNQAVMRAARQAPGAASGLLNLARGVGTAAGTGVAALAVAATTQQGAGNGLRCAAAVFAAAYLLVWLRAADGRFAASRAGK